MLWKDVRSLFALFLAVLASVSAALAQEIPAEATRSVFAISWQPGFCATSPDRPECATGAAVPASPAAFSLHGLWPMGESYCGVAENLAETDRSGRWLDLPEPTLEPETAQAVRAAMPGTKSGLDRHQWLRFGTCHGGTAEAYFALQLTFLNAINASPVGRLFNERQGGEVTQDLVRQAFDAGFGQGAGERVRMRCATVDGRPVVTGLSIGLGEPKTSADDLATLIQAAGVTPFKCARGLIASASGAG